MSGVWQTDITYIQLTNHSWVYLATVLDPEKRKVLGYKISDTMTADLATSGLRMAFDKHRKPLIIHSDMGSQYTSAEFNIKCQNYGLKHSYSLKGHPYDNGRMEAFHSILKREEVYLKAYQTLTEVQAAIGWYINFYNRNRISNVAYYECNLVLLHCCHISTHHFLLKKNLINIYKYNLNIPQY